MSGRHRPNRLHRPLLEALEDRTLLSVYTVDRLTDTGDGSELAGDLRYCISQASDHDSVRFGVEGVIKLTAALPELTHSVSINGPGPGALTVQRDTGGMYRLFTIGSGATVEISGLTLAYGAAEKGASVSNSGVLTISNSNLSRNVADSYGGGIYNTGTLTVNNSTLSGNSTTYGGGGGGIYNSGTLTISRSTFSANFAGGPYGGGGIFNSGMLTISGSTFSGNGGYDSGGIGNSGTVTVTGSIFNGNSGYGSGGGIQNRYGTVTVSDSTFSGNSELYDSGGGIYNSSGTLTVTGSTFSGNSAGAGGGIQNFGTATVTDSTFSANSGTYGGGGIVNAETLTVTGCTFSANSTPYEGGGIWNYGSLTVTESTFSRNTSRSDGGSISNYGTLTITSSTFSGNSAGDRGGGIDNYSGRLTIRNTLLAGNVARSGGPDVEGQLNSQGHNLIGIGDGASGYAATDLVGTSASPLDARLGSLQDNGGPTQTLALLPGSPAVDAGDNTDAPDYDQRGPNFFRIVGGIIDIGAFEAQIGATSRLLLSAPSHVIAGVPFAVTLIALDDYGHVASGYTGTVTFTSSDTVPGIILPADYTFQASDGGMHTFTAGVTLITLGDQTLTATDTVDSTISGSAIVTVSGPAAPPGGGASGPRSPTMNAGTTPTGGMESAQQLALLDRLFSSLNVGQLPNPRLHYRFSPPPRPTKRGDRGHATYIRVERWTRSARQPTMSAASPRPSPKRR